MFTPSDTDSDTPVDRWAIRLDEPQPVAHASGSDPEGDTAPLPLFTLDVPTLEFQPRLSRFGDAA